ncbi:hypothetical protein FOMPIDRAFT_1042811 [Fomitopsis schrenkii]|uniref:Uncharacterized protein n=1 Tax=Fomitopsis schrenkii TaxID=2126942 RepID=S8DWU3_FOMSC|nr:hypothetical protein FOMPIDRAFT_1042811 [Fomitopsis schrenkii]
MPLPFLAIVLIALFVSSAMTPFIHLSNKCLTQYCGGNYLQLPGNFLQLPGNFLPVRWIQAGRHQMPVKGDPTITVILCLVGPITGPQAVQFASEPQPLLTSPSDLGDLGRAAGLWPEASEGGSIPSQVHKSNRTHRVRYVSDSGNLVTIDSESSSSGEHDDRSTSLEQQSRDDDDVESDVSGSPNGSNAAPESPIDMQDNSVPLARVDDGCPVVSTEVEDANSVTPDDTDSYGFRVTVYTEPGAVALHDGNLDMTVYEVNDSDVVSDTRPVYEDSDVDSMAATDDESACGTMPPNGGDFDIAANEVDDMLSDAYSESVVEADDILSDTQSVSGVSDTSSWITTDDSAADCSSPDVESDSSAWITTDDSVPDDSDLGSPITTKTGPLPAGSDAPSLAHSHSGIFGEDDLSHSAASSSRDTTSRLEELNSPALSELADDICAHLDFLLQPTGPDSVEDETLQRMPPSTSVVSSLSTSGRDWEPAAPGFVFSVGAPVPSTSSPTLSTSRLPSLRSPSASDGHAALGNSQDQRDGTPRSKLNTLDLPNCGPPSDTVWLVWLKLALMSSSVVSPLRERFLEAHSHRTDAL